MRSLSQLSIRTRLTLWYVSVLAAILFVYVCAVLAFQYAQLQRQIYHDEVQDMVTVEGLLRFDNGGHLEVQQDYFVRPQNRLLVDRYMEVLDRTGQILYRSRKLGGEALGPAPFEGEGEGGFNERTVTLVNGTKVFLISHVHPLNGQPLLIRLGYSMAPLNHNLKQFLLLLILALPIALTVASLAGYAIARHALAPLKDLTSRAEKITARSLSERLSVPNQNDELGHVAGVLNHLLDRLERSFAELQRFTSNAAHELRTPLVGIRVLGEAALERWKEPDELLEAIGSMLEKTHQLSQTIDALLLLARTELEQTDYVQERLSLPAVVAEVLSVLEVVVEERHISIREQGGEGERHEVYADRSLVRVALLNVLHNALKFSPPGSEVRITYAHAMEAGQRWEEVLIHDAGPGIAPGEHEKVLERFFTSKDTRVANGAGSGLGLSIAKLALQRSGGRIAFDQSIQSGARCRLLLPAMADA